MRNTILKQKMGVAILSLTLFVVPTVALGASLIPCGNIKDASGAITDPCDFNSLITLANNIISFLMYDVAVPLAALGIMWAGGKLVVNQNKESAWSEAKESFGNIGMGFLIMLGAFVLIKFVLFTFLHNDQITFMKFMLDVTQ